MKFKILDNALKVSQKKQNELLKEVKRIEAIGYKYKKEKQKDLNAIWKEIHKNAKERDVLINIKTDVYMINKIKSQLR